MKSRIFNYYFSSKPKKTLFFLILILILGSILRFYKLGQIPQILTRDEAAIGYNAYSLIETGKSEYGVKFPLWFKSFGDYKPPVYIYATSIIIKIFGLSEFSVRFLSTISGILIILIAFLLANEIFKNFSEEFRDRISLFFSFLIAIAPWSIHYSRMAYVSNLSILLSTTGILFLLKARKKSLYFFLALLFLVTCFFTYSSSTFILPILVPLIIFFFFKEYNQKKYIVICFSLFFYASLVLYVILSKHYVKARLEGTILHPLYIETKRAELRDKNKQIPLILLRNKPLILYSIVSNYVLAFKPSFLFFGGDYHPWHGIRLGDDQIGNEYLITLPFFISGLVFILRIKRREFFFILAWFLITPIACSFTQDVPNTNRMLEFLLTFLFISATGLIYILKLSKKFQLITVLLLILIMFISLQQYLNAYIHYYEKIFCSYNLKTMDPCGLKEISNFIQKHPNYDKVIFFVGQDSTEPYIKIAFNLKFNPEEFQKEAEREKLSFTYVKKYKNFYFLVYTGKKSIDQLKKIAQTGKNLYILRDRSEFKKLYSGSEAIIKKEIFQVKDYNNNILWIIGE